MKGIVFNLLEEVTRRKHGERVWDTVLETARVDGAYTSVGQYPDADFLKLLATTATVLKLPPDEVVRWLGTQALPLLARRFPAFFSPHKSTRAFLLTLNGLVQSEVHKLYPGAEVPEFTCDNSAPEALTLTYRSKRRLCALAEGLIYGTATHYREVVRLEHPLCMKRKDKCCVFRLAFLGKGG